jgi:CHAD domain-containing protein
LNPRRAEDVSDGKWLHGLRGDMPVGEAARLVLPARLIAVRDHLPHAVHHADQDPEHVHQLRVSTRRAGAALRIFVDCLPEDIFNRVRKRLRRLRRAASAARDWDVFLQFVRQRQRRAAPAQRPGLDLLLGIAQGQRMAAQQVLLHAVQDPPLDIDALVDATGDGLKRSPFMSSRQSLRDLAVPLLTELLVLLNQAAQGDGHDYEQLHQVRIRGKRLRYAMEVFACCFESSFQDTYYPAFEKLQEILGQANDSRVAAERLEAIRAQIKAHPPAWRRYRAGVEIVLQYHQRVLPQKRKQYLGWWTDWQRSGAEQAFAKLLNGQ